MKILYLDCSMGAAGDMLAAALMELLPDREAFVREMNGLGIPGVQVKSERAVKCGITGTHFSVLVDGTEEGSGERGHGHMHGERSHSHRTLHSVEHIVMDQLQLPERVKKDVMAVYRMIAEAESRVHGVPVTEIHFHEVGAMDAVADITAVCLLMYRLAPDEVVVSPVHVGSGQVRCAHGILPVPAPAAACLLQEIPIYGGSVKGELCTPTGAALLKYFGTGFGDMPPMRARAIGYGMGKKDFEAANCVRALLGETEGRGEKVLELSCNLDDMTAEEIGFAMERLFEGGALEVYTVPVGMKKSRPGILLCVLCKEKQKEEITALLFRHTTTIGIREQEVQRYVLKRKTEELETPYGRVRRKDSEGYGICRSKYEYEDLAAIARERRLSLAEVIALLEGAGEKG